MNLASTLSELGERLGIGNIELDQDGGCLLAFDNDLLVDFEQATDEPGCYLTATVCLAPQEDREAVFAELLEANALGVGDGGNLVKDKSAYRGVQFEINKTNQHGVYTIKALSEKPLANITDYSSGMAVATPSDPAKSKYSYEIEARIDVNNPDQPVTFIKPPTASITHAPASKDKT